jgi:DNA-binding transcriptional MerR regulator
MPDLTIGELARQSGVTPRTIRYYIELGLLPPPHGGRRVATYREEHLRRIHLIRKLQASRLSLDEIRERLGVMSPVEAEAIASDTSGPAPDSALDYIQRLREMPNIPYAEPMARLPATPPSERGETYISEPWARIPLSEDVELHVRRRGNRIDRRISKLIEEARRILAEEENT